MKVRSNLLLLVMALGVSAVGVYGQSPQGLSHRRVVVPSSSVEHPGDRGKKAHTNHLILISTEPAAKSGTTPTGETPGSLACVYSLISATTPGCPIATSTAVPAGGNGTIAVVVAFDYPTAYKDLSTFSRQFGLPVLPQCSRTKTTSCFQKVYAAGVQPPVDCGWAQEAALDIEWAHAMAPNASIVLVEAASNQLSDLAAGVDVGNAFINPTGASAGSGLGQVTMSWGASEFAGETAYDYHFTTPGVVYFASSGDTGGIPIYPGTSPNVVSAGGTTIVRSGGLFVNEIAWGSSTIGSNGSGGGTSPVETIPPYQSSISSLVGFQRGVPDLAFNSDPGSGVSVFDSTPCQTAGPPLTNNPVQVGWQVFGGTSVAAPSLAGIVNSAGSVYNSTDTELTAIYSCSASASCYSLNFHDITAGTAGTFSAGPGWDFITGVGSPSGLGNK